MKITRCTTLACVIAAAMLTAGCGGAATESASPDADCSQPGDTGITDDTIKVGQTLPQSGPVAAFGAISNGVQAYFDKINADGGVTMGDGKTRKLELISLDDKYEPAEAVRNANELIEEEEVFAMLANFGSANQLAVKESVDAACIPNLWIGSGNPALQEPANEYSFGSSISVTKEAGLWAEYLKKEKPQAKVAVLYIEGETGQPVLDAFKKSLEGSDVVVVGEASFAPTDTDVRQQITTLSKSGADVLFNIAVQTTAKQAINNAHSLGWKPTILNPYVTTLNVDAVKQLDAGADSDLVVFEPNKDVTSPEFEDDEVVADYLAHFAETDGADSYRPIDGVAGWNAATFFIEALENTDEADRAALLDQALHMTYSTPNLAYPGVKLSVDAPTDVAIQEGGAILRWNSGSGAFDVDSVIDLQE